MNKAGGGERVGLPRPVPSLPCASGACSVK
jgi:hypothetical protein